MLQSPCQQQLAAQTSKLCLYLKYLKNIYWISTVKAVVKKQSWFHKLMPLTRLISVFQQNP